MQKNHDAPAISEYEEPAADEFARLTREFVLKEFPPYRARALAEPKTYPRALMEQCAAIGLLGLEIPPEYGGNAVSPVQQATVMAELARGDAGFSLDILVQNSLTAYPIARFGSAEQQGAYLPRMASGELIACFGLTEPNTGSDAKAIRLKAVHDDARGGWVVNGAKRFITSANAASLMVMAARTGKPQDRGRAITVFLAEIGPGVAGVEVSVFNKLGQPGSQLCEVVFTNFFVPDGALMGNVNEGWQIVEATLHHSRTWIAAQGLGIAQHALDEADKYAHEREQFGKKLIDIPEVRNHLRLIARQVAITRALIHRAAEREEASDEHAFVWASVAKLVAGETCLWAAHEAMLLHGGMGYTTEMPVSYLLPDAVVIRIYEGAAHIQVKIIEKYLPKEAILPLLPPTGAFLLDADDLPAASAVVADFERRMSASLAGALAHS